jgi:hypothetical protein
VQFKNLLGIDTVLLGIGLEEGNAHAPNEYIDLNNFFGGIRTFAHFYNELPNYWDTSGKKTKARRGGLSKALPTWVDPA